VALNAQLLRGLLLRNDLELRLSAVAAAES